MKESARAARHETAHERCVAALKNISSVSRENVEALEGVRVGRKSVGVRAMMETEAMADILESLKSGQEKKSGKVKR